MFTPETEGGPAYEVSYLWFDGGLDAALDSMGAASTRLRIAVLGSPAASAPSSAYGTAGTRR